MEQRDKVMQQGYVFFDRKPMVMKPWNPIDNFTKEEVTNVPTWIQLRGLDIKYWGETSLFKIVGQLGEPLQVDNVTKNRDMLQYPRILILWNRKLSVNCSGIGHERGTGETSMGAKTEKKIEGGKQIDADGFQKVSKGKKMLIATEQEETIVRNMFETLGDEPKNVINTGGEGDPSSSNG
uniref:DUF4283 domain-containing protein n=1 Tax=Cannabis sativa TaxID=3483 RepID=A0A803PYE6_CANSA